MVIGTQFLQFSFIAFGLLSYSLVSSKYLTVPSSSKKSNCRKRRFIAMPERLGFPLLPNAEKLTCISGLYLISLFVFLSVCMYSFSYSNCRRSAAQYVIHFVSARLS